MTTGAPRPFTVLTVCTGNICRSPLAEQLLAAKLGGAGAFRVVSAGTRAQDGAAMDATAAEMSEALGGDPARHTATYLTEEVVEAADLVLTASAEHRAAVATLSPRASRRSFTLRQFARLADAVDRADLAAADGPEAVVALVGAARGYAPPARDPDDDDIVDPYRRSRATHELAATLIDEAVTSAVAALTAPHRVG